MSEINFSELIAKLFILDNRTGSEFFGGQEIFSIDPLKFYQFWGKYPLKQKVLMNKRNTLTILI